jgi:hypothetical protein
VAEAELPCDPQIIGDATSVASPRSGHGEARRATPSGLTSDASAASESRREDGVLQRAEHGERSEPRRHSE